MQNATGVTVDGVDCIRGNGSGWTWNAETGELTLSANREYVLSGTAKADNFHVCVAESATVRAFDLILDSNDTIANTFEVTANKTVVLQLAGINKFSNAVKAYVGGAIFLDSGSRLVVTNAPGWAEADAVLTCRSEYVPAICLETPEPRATFVMAGGTLTANGGYRAAAIGGGNVSDSLSDLQVGNVEIRGGRTKVFGGHKGAGIGTGCAWQYGLTYEIVISGGYVEAVGGEDAAAIGGGCDSMVALVKVSGGTVKATRGNVLMTPLPAVDLISGFNRSPEGDQGLFITGGSVYPTHIETEDVRDPASNGKERVYCVTVPGLAGGRVASVERLEDYGCKDLEVIDGRIYLWLPDGEYRFFVRDEYFEVKVQGANAVAQRRTASAGVCVNNQDCSVGSGPGWTWDRRTGELALTEEREYVLSGTAKPTNFHVFVAESATVQASNLVLRTDASITNTFEVTTNKTVVLQIAGVNEFANVASSMVGGAVFLDTGSRVVVTNAPGWAEADAVLTCLSSGTPAICLVTPEPRATFVMAGGTLTAKGGGHTAAIGGGVNSFKSDRHQVGNVEIRGGRTTAIGGYRGAGIGTGSDWWYGSTHEITISGGYVEAVGGTDAAAIGGGAASHVGCVTISGGTVKATRGAYEQSPGLRPVDLICGFARSPEAGQGLFITGGSVYPTHIGTEDVRGPASNGKERVYCVTVPGFTEGSPHVVADLGDYGSDDLVAVDGCLYLWLPNGMHRFRVDGTVYEATVAGANTKATRLDATGVTVDGLDCIQGVGSGWRWDISSGELLLDGASGHVLSGRATNDHVRVVASGTMTVVVSNLCLTTAGASAFEAAPNASVTLLVDGTNDFSYVGTDGECGALRAESGSRLVVTNAPGRTDGVLVCRSDCTAAVALETREPAPTFVMAGGTLVAYGGDNSAGIGGRAVDQGLTRVLGRIEFCGGRTKAFGGSCAAGIGTGYCQWAPTPAEIVIRGGYVEAVGGTDAAAIGGGADSFLGRVTVLGGTVKATRGEPVDWWPSPHAADLVCGWLRSPAEGEGLFITGGSVYPTHLETEDVRGTASDGKSPVYCVAVTNLTDGAPLALTGLAGYGTNDLESVDGRLYLWLPNGDYRFSVNGTNYQARVADAHTSATVYKEAFVIIEDASGTYRIPYVWLEGYGLVKPEADYDAHHGAAVSSSSNPVSPQAVVRLPNWKSYVAGLDPTNATDLFYATIERVPPNLWSVGPNKVREGRRYGVSGSPALTSAAVTNYVVGADGRALVPSGTNEFFRVSVNVKNEE